MQYTALALAALASVASAQNATMMNLTSTLANDSSLSNLTTYLGLYPQFTSMLAGLTNITLIAPNNMAFTKLLNSPAGAAIQANDTALIQAVFSYHVLNGTYYADQIKTMPQFIPSALVNPAYSNVTGGQVVEAVKVGTGTYFFSGLLSNSSVVQANMNFTGGVIHVVDTFLTVPQNISTTAVDLNLTSAVGALTKANISGVVDTTPELTCFIPNNAAFQAIGSALSNISMPNLASVLEYHVIKGAVDYSTMLSNTSLMTLQGNNVTITVDNGTVFVDSARVMTPNVLVANGVVHVIDAVLNPNNTSAAPNVTASTAAPAFSGASSVSEVPFTSGIQAPSSAVATATGSGGVAGSGGSSSASSSGLAQPMKTGAVGAAALFGGAAMIMNY